MSALAKFLAKMKGGAAGIGRAGMGLGAMGGLKGLEFAQEHPNITKGVAAGAGTAALLAALGGGSRPSDEDQMEEYKQYMLDKYADDPSMSRDILDGFKRHPRGY